MKGLVLVFGVLIAFVAAQEIDCTNGCPPTDPPPPVVRCPDCVKARCSYSMCAEAIGVAFPGDCTKFCICDHVGPIEFHCPDGLYFDDNLGVCAAAYDSTCRNDEPYPECDIGCAPTTAAPCTSTSTCTPATTSCTTPCPTTPTPCTTTSTCTPATTSCTTPCPTTPTPCTTTSTCTPATTSCTTPCPTTSAPCTTTSTCTPATTSCTTTTSAPVVRCPDCVNQYCTYDMCSEAKHVTYPGDCTKFCKCDHVGAVEFTCPDGLFFNPALEVCDWPYNVDCGGCKNMAKCG